MSRLGSVHDMCMRVVHTSLQTLSHPHAVSEILNALINIYKQLFRVSTLTDAVLFSKYPQTALTLDEILKEASTGLRAAGQ